MKLDNIKKLQKELESAGRIEWIATKESMLEISEDSVESPLLMKTKTLFDLPLFLVIRMK